MDMGRLATRGATAATSSSTTNGGVVNGNGNAPGGSLLPTPASVPGNDRGCMAATVAFVVDGSGSMCEPFGGSTRWTTLRAALLDRQAGLIYRVQDRASFGMYLYDGTIDFMLAQGAAAGPASTCMSPNAVRRFQGMCPQIIEVPPVANNAMAIDAKYPMTELGGSTPTDKVMNYVVDALIKARGPHVDPQYIILATDGQPNDICMGGTGGDGTLQQRNVIAAVDRGAAMGITTFVISLASDPALQMHLDEVARHGDVTNPGAHSFSPMAANDLVLTLSNLLGAAIGCPI
jgi:hypothetical protein